MSLVKGHWRMTSSGKRTWVKEHFRNVQENPSPVGCGSILAFIYFLFMAPFHILGSMNALFNTNFMGGTNEIEVWIPLCVVVFIVLIIMFVIGFVKDIPILQYLPIIVVSISLVFIIILFVAGILEILRIIGDFIGQFR